MAVEAKGQIEIGVVLQGGGALGAYEYGAIDALLELMDKIESDGRTVRLVAVTGVSIGAINAACVVGARDRADARRRLKSLWDGLSLEPSRYWWAIAKSDFALFGVHGFYVPRRDIWTFLDWTNFYDTQPMLKTLKEHVDFDLLNASATAFVITAVNRSSGELIRFRNHPHKKQAQTTIEPAHVLASGSLPPAFPATTIDSNDFWDGGIIDNTPLGDAIDAFSESSDADRILIVMNLFRKERASPKNMIEVNDRLAELRYGNRLRQDRQNAHNVNELLQTIEDLVALVPPDSMDQQLEARVDDARRFKVLDAITEIDLADPAPVDGADPLQAPGESGAFRDFSTTGIQRRHDIGYRIAQLKLQEVFETRGLLPAHH
jgi:predicted acylesterase/phospholipase RssA